MRRAAATILKWVGLAALIFAEIDGVLNAFFAFFGAKSCITGPDPQCEWAFASWSPFVWIPVFVLLYLPWTPVFSVYWGWFVIIPAILVLYVSSRLDDHPWTYLERVKYHLNALNTNLGSCMIAPWASLAVLGFFYFAWTMFGLLGVVVGLIIVFPIFMFALSIVGMVAVAITAIALLPFAIILAGLGVRTPDESPARSSDLAGW
jgi:hypothetical protein